MKHVLTGCDPVLQPDLTRRLIITDEWFSLTLDALDPRTGRMRFNGPVKFRRVYNFFAISRTDPGDRPATQYTVSGGFGTTNLDILVYDARPFELNLTVNVFNDATNSYAPVYGPSFQLDHHCRAAWRAFVDDALRNIDLHRLTPLARSLGANAPDYTNLNWLAYKLTPTEVM